MSFTYFGDDYLEFHDYINGVCLDDMIEAEINTNAGFIRPIELAYYTGAKKKLIQSFECVKELKNEKDTSKHVEILAKYGLKPVDVPNNTDYLQ